MPLSRENLGELFRGFKRSAVRFECQQTYTMPAEQEDLNRFLAGESKPEGHNDAWMDTVSSNLAAGKTMQRLKVVRRPFTDYTRYLFAWAIPDNVKAGEDYRVVDVTHKELDLPGQDFWIFDEHTVAILNFNPDGTLRDRERADDVEPYLKWRDVALAESVPFGDYRP